MAIKRKNIREGGMFGAGVGVRSFPFEDTVHYYFKNANRKGSGRRIKGG